MKVYPYTLRLSDLYNAEEDINDKASYFLRET